VHVISRKALRVFSERHPKAERPLDAWYRTARRARWASLADVRLTYPHTNHYRTCTIFNIAGNHFRLIAKLYYGDQVVLARGADARGVRPGGKER
jgi:mRNA interferase HigB